MPAVASVEDLRAVQAALDAIKLRDSSLYDEFVALFKTHRKVGFKNICKIMLAESTPEKLKGIDP